MVKPTVAVNRYGHPIRNYRDEVILLRSIDSICAHTLIVASGKRSDDATIDRVEYDDDWPKNNSADPA